MILNYYEPSDDKTCVDTYNKDAKQHYFNFTTLYNTLIIEPLCVRLYTSDLMCLNTVHRPILWDPKRVTQFNQYTTECTYKKDGNLLTTLCDYSSSECFLPDRICSFERDIYGDPVHCTDTGHLRFCKTHKCPDAFKCHESYCIPIHMVCDMIADCPDGEDEYKCDAVVTKGMFRYVCTLHSPTLHTIYYKNVKA